MIVVTAVLMVEIKNFKNSGRPYHILFKDDCLITGVAEFEYRIPFTFRRSNYFAGVIYAGSGLTTLPGSRLKLP